MALAARARGQTLPTIFLVLLLLLTASSFPTRWDSESFAVNTSDGYFALSKIIQGIAIPLSLVVFAQSWRTIIARLRAGWMWLAVNAWLMLSVLWSVEPRITFFGAALILLMMFMTGFVAARLDEPEVSRVVAVYTLILCGVSMTLGLTLPDYGLMNTPKFAGLLRGVYSHKNLLADTVSLLLLWLLCATAAGATRGRLTWAAIVVAAVTVVWTWSTTSILMILVCIGLLVSLRSALVLRIPAPALLALVVVFTLLACVIVPLISDAVLAYFGKDMSFTGRDRIWRAYLDLAAQRPWTGFGYRAISVSEEYGISIRFGNGSRPSPHNSFIVLYVDGGLPAVGAYIAINLLILFRGLRQIGRGDRLGMFAVAFPVGYAINSLMEGTGAMFVSFGLIALFYLTMRPATVPLRLPRVTSGGPVRPGLRLAA